MADGVNTSKLCEINGCERTCHGRSLWCKPHYSKVNYISTRKPDACCSVDGCFSTFPSGYNKTGICRYHYERRWQKAWYEVNPAPLPPTQTCNYCEKEFQPNVNNSNWQKSCSLKCSWKNRNAVRSRNRAAAPKSWVVRFCVNCGRQFEASGRGRDRKKYCSGSCASVIYNSRRRTALMGTFVEDIDRGQVFRNHNGFCYLCGQIIIGYWELDHIIPVSRGGLHAYSNVAPTHRRCNASKNNKLLSDIS